MAFSIFFSLTIIVIISFVATKKNLHLFEIIFMWMIIIIIHHTLLTLAVLNLKLLDFADQPEKYWTLVFTRVLLIPCIIIWYFDRTLLLRPYKKWTLLPFVISVLAGVEYLTDLLNIVKYIHWKLWWSLLEWLVILLLVNFSWIWFRNHLRKEMK